MDPNVLREAVASMYQDTPDAVVLYDTTGHTIAANEAAQALTGYRPEEFVGSPYRLHMADETDLSRVDLAMKTALAGGTDHFDTHAKHRDGTVIPVECYVFPARFNNQIVGVFAQARDIVALRTAESSLTINQEKFRSLFEYHPDGIMELKSSGAISRVNVALEGETGFFGERIVGKPWIELIAPERREVAHELLRSAMRGEAVEADTLLLDRLGNRLDVQLKLVPLHSSGEITGAYAIFKNVAAQRAAERAIAAQSERLRRLVMVAASGHESHEVQIDEALALGVEMFGWDIGYVAQYQRDRVLLRNASGEALITKGTIYPTRASFAYHVMERRGPCFVPDMDSPEHRDDPIRVTTPWRSYFGVPLTVFNEFYGALVFAGRAPRDETIDPSERDLVQLIGLFVSAALERAAQNERIEQMAFNDSLTGLPNRVLFTDRIEQTIATARRYDRGFAVMYLDVDHFKAINDKYGHAVGDAALQEVAHRLRLATRESDTLSRFGGDEFVILQPIVDGPSDAADLARKLNVAMQDPVVIDGVQHKVRLSIGIALYPSDGTTIETLMEAADRALYRAKKEGRNRWCFADAETARRTLTKPRVMRREAAE
ncbi:MAG TPA: diguanylate cyclase [Candidatus Acidoferrum sp.]|jgi:diguanylate cyclase (GGDEF)-like protein/PAS domain S-box-containing protein|nr:diguanylate cyclase [Candidatus Acidoferrum sp.]